MNEAFCNSCSDFDSSKRFFLYRTLSLEKHRQFCSNIYLHFSIFNVYFYKLYQSCGLSRKRSTSSKPRFSTTVCNCFSASFRIYRPFWDLALPPHTTFFSNLLPKQQDTPDIKRLYHNQQKTQKCIVWSRTYS